MHACMGNKQSMPHGACNYNFKCAVRGTISSQKKNKKCGAHSAYKHAIWFQM